jgi:hypothetical protein
MPDKSVTTLYPGKFLTAAQKHLKFSLRTSGLNLIFPFGKSNLKPLKIGISAKLAIERA